LSLVVTGDFVLFADRICAVIAEPTADAALARIRWVLRRSRAAYPTVELRLDWLSKRKELGKLLRRLRGVLRTPDKDGKHPRPRLCVIATLRRRGAGGRFDGGLAEQWATLLAAAKAGCAWCDVEVESAELLGKQGMTELRQAGAKVLVSFHDFRRTPGGLRWIVRRLERCGGDAIKIATHCRTLGDSVRLLRTAEGRRDVVAVPMGEAGLPGRVLALRRGSALAYAAAEAATAPGQLSLQEMRELYRADQLDRRTRIYGVIGDPVLHSLSPVLHDAAYAARHVNAVYVPIPVRELRDFLKAMPSLGLAGFSITLPHKQAILRHLAKCDPLAARIGAVNTVVVQGDGRLHGYNTDYIGVLRALKSRLRLRGSRVLLLGAGGAARAAAFALAEAGANVVICARRATQSRELARTVGGEAVSRPALRKARFAAIINATPVGLAGASGSPLQAGEMNCEVVMDMVYRPIQTPLLRLAARRGVETVSGVEMFVAQAAAQWEIWFGGRAPVAVMRRAVLAALRREEGLAPSW
jgi:3-dehydroquinate dehydratase/shikimate dehydrogenase